MRINSINGAITETPADTAEQVVQRQVDLGAHKELLVAEGRTEHVRARGVAWNLDIAASLAGPLNTGDAVWVVIGTLIDALAANTPEAERTAELTRLIASKALIEDTYPKPIT